MNEFALAYRRMLRRLKREGDIVDYKVWTDDDGTIHADIQPLPALRHITIDSKKYQTAINAMIDDLQEKV